jgi:hypothetical protein
VSPNLLGDPSPVNARFVRSTTRTPLNETRSLRAPSFNQQHKKDPTPFHRPRTAIMMSRPRAALLFFGMVCLSSVAVGLEDGVAGTVHTRVQRLSSTTASRQQVPHPIDFCLLNYCSSFRRPVTRTLRRSFEYALRRPFKFAIRDPDSAEGPAVRRVGSLSNSSAVRRPIPSAF